MNWWSYVILITQLIVAVRFFETSCINYYYYYYYEETHHRHTGSIDGVSDTSCWTKKKHNCLLARPEEWLVSHDHGSGHDVVKSHLVVNGAPLPVHLASQPVYLPVYLYNRPAPIAIWRFEVRAAVYWDGDDEG